MIKGKQDTPIQQVKVEERTHLWPNYGNKIISRAIGLVLKGLTWKSVITFLDDGQQTTGMKLKPSKCHLFKRSVVFLGKLVSDRCIEVNPFSVDTVKLWPVPKKMKDIEAIMGYINYHRAHIDHLAEIAEPLYKLTKAKTDFE